MDVPCFLLSLQWHRRCDDGVRVVLAARCFEQGGGESRETSNEQERCHPDVADLHPFAAA